MEKEQKQSKSDKSSGNLDPASWLSEYGDMMYRYAYLQLRDSSKAEDVLQETLLSAYRARDTFEGRASIKSWLMTILRNKIIDSVRSDARKKLELVENYDDAEINQTFNKYGIWSNWLKSWGSSPDSLLEEKAFLRQVEFCISKLPSTMREVFVLRNVDGLTTDEICEKFNIKDNNLWVLLYRARLRMRECLDKNWFNKG